MPGPTHIRLNPVSQNHPNPPEHPHGFYNSQRGWEWHTTTRNTYQFVGERWVDVSDAEVFGDFCYSHMRREPTHPSVGSFKTCGECHHVWLDEDEFVSDVAYLNSKLGMPFAGISEEDYLVCPLCGLPF